MRKQTYIAVLGLLAMAHGVRGQGKSIVQVVRVAEFQVLNRAAESQAYEVLSLIDSAGKDWVNHCRAVSCVNIPFGEYRYSLSRSIHGNRLSGTALLTYPDVLITVLSDPYGQGTSIPGKISGQQERQGIWISAKLIAGDYSRYARVGENGEFRLHGMLPGKYVVTVVQGNRILSNGIYDCNGSLTELATDPASDTQSRRIRIEFGRGFMPWEGGR